MEYCSAIKENELQSVLVRWMNLEPVTQSEVSQKKLLYIFLVFKHFILYWSTDDQQC